MKKTTRIVRSLETKPYENTLRELGMCGAQSHLNALYMWFGKYMMGRHESEAWDVYKSGSDWPGEKLDKEYVCFRMISFVSDAVEFVYGEGSFGVWYLREVREKNREGEREVIKDCVDWI